MRRAYKTAAIAGGLAVAGLAVVAVFGIIGAAAGLAGWSMYGGGGGLAMSVEAELSAMEGEIAAVKAERDTLLRGLGIRSPGLGAAEAAEIRERAGPILARYVSAYAGGAVPGEAAVEALNAEYDALLAGFGAAPQELDGEQVRAITEWRVSELERLADIHARYGNPELWELERDAAELARIGVDVRAISRSVGAMEPGLGAEEELALAMRLAPLEQRYEEIHRELSGAGDDDADALQAELAELDGQAMAVSAAAGAGLPEAPDAQASAPSP